MKIALGSACSLTDRKDPYQALDHKGREAASLKGSQDRFLQSDQAAQAAEQMLLEVAIVAVH